MSSRIFTQLEPLNVTDTRTAEELAADGDRPRDPDNKVAEGLPCCPFCGSLPRVRPEFQTKKVNCKNIRCGIFEVAMTPENWSKRYAEGNHHTAG